jgi:hypothetical protein
VREWQKVAPTYVADGVFRRYVEKVQQTREGKEALPVHGRVNHWRRVVHA